MPFLTIYKLPIVLGLVFVKCVELNLSQELFFLNIISSGEVWNWFIPILINGWKLLDRL